MSNSLSASGALNGPQFASRLTAAQRLQMLEPREGMLRAILDTDTFNEIDDQFALIQALLSPGRIEIEAIYAAPFFNQRAESPGDGMDRSYEEIGRLLDLFGRPSEGFVFRGVREYVGAKKEPRAAEAVTDLIRRARASSPEDPLHVVAIGAISNVASALLAAPDITDRLVVVWLGGHALHWPHTVEFNLKQDVGGAQVLFDSGVPLVLVPCQGVTSHLNSSVPEIERFVEPHGALGNFLSRRYREYREDQFGRSKEIWDMAAVAYLLNADWTPSVVIPTPILTDQMTWSTDERRHLMRYVRHVERDSILKDFFLKLAAFAKHR
jgi:inosine-uridine nucleoside N-ribohydrolase